MRSDLTELIFILDRSGSMHGLEADTIGGFNRVLDEHRAMPGQAIITTVLFDDKIKLLHDRLPIAAVRLLTAEDYVPGGMTALLDAVGMAIDKIAAVQDSVSKEHRAAHVQFVIITDGMENSSRRFSLPRIRHMIDEARRERGWDFLFLGANIDAVDVAERMAIPAERAVTAMSDSTGVGLQYEAVCKATTSFRRAAHPCAAPDASWKANVEKDTARRRR